MISYGRSIRWYRDYREEAAYTLASDYDFMQIWFQQGKLLLDKIEGEPVAEIIKAGCPVIIHALMDFDDYEVYMEDLMRYLIRLNHNELIIHPICTTEPINQQTMDKLCEKLNGVAKQLKRIDVKLYVENNSVIDPINYKCEDLQKLYKNKDVHFLLDVAHIDSYEHLEQILNIRMPEMLHLSDKHMVEEHEHLPIGEGDLDFNLIFNSYLKDFNGKIIFEVIHNDNQVLDDSLNIVREIV